MVAWRPRESRKNIKGHEENTQWQICSLSRWWCFHEFIHVKTYQIVHFKKTANNEGHFHLSQEDPWTMGSPFSPSSFCCLCNNSLEVNSSERLQESTKLLDYFLCQWLQIHKINTSGGSEISVHTQPMVTVTRTIVDPSLEEAHSM